MALPKNGLSFPLIARELGILFNWDEPPTLYLSELCLHPNINKWSRWKPVIFKQVNRLTDAQLATTNFGLQPPDPTTRYDLVVNKRWEYNRPNGTVHEPFRASDFNYYDRNAGSIANVMSDRRVNTSDITKLQIALPMNITGSDTMIGLNDFIDDVGSYYYGVVFESGLNYAVKHIKTATLDLENKGNSFEVSMNEAPFNTLQINPIKLYHVLVSESVPTMTTLGGTSRNYISIPSDSNNISEITLTTGTAGDYAIDFTHIGTSIGTMQDIQPYLTIDAPSFQTSGNIFFKVELVNSKDKSANLAVSNLKISAQPNFFGQGYTENSVLLDSGGTPITSITIPAGQTRVVYVGANNLVNRDNSAIATPPIGTEVSSSIKLLKGTDRIAELLIKLKAV